MLSDIYFGCCCRNLQTSANSYLVALQHHGQMVVKDLPPSAARSILDGQMERMLHQDSFCPGFDVIRHDPPNEADQFPSCRRHSYILFLAMAYHSVILAAHSGITAISVGYHLCAVSGLPGPQNLRFMTDQLSTCDSQGRRALRKDNGSQKTA